MRSPETCFLPKNGLSHVEGPRDNPLLDVTIPALMRTTVDAYGSRPACVFSAQNIHWTYDEFDAEVDALAAGFNSLGLKKGDRIGIWSPNRVEWLLTQFATARLGLVMVNINPAYRTAELEYVLNKVECEALVLAANFKTSDYLQILHTLAPELDKCAPGDLQSKRLPHLRCVMRMGIEMSPGMYNFNDILESGRHRSRADLDAISATLSHSDPINIQFTSGTTGSPKGATLTHQNIVNNAHNVISTIAFTSEDRLCIPVPLYHCFGMVMGSLGCVSLGAAMVFPGEGFEPQATLTTLSDEKCTGLYGVPTMFVAMMEHLDFSSQDFSNLRTGIMAGAPCPIEVMKRVVSDMNMDQVTIAYGMTETSPVSFQSHVDDPLEKRVTTVGRIHPHVECKVIDENGKTVPVGQQGELCTRGYSVMQGYWGDDERTAESIDDAGWMHTGDLAVIDAEGYCNIVGRVKDMLIRGGENVYPREIENFLFRHEAVQDVQVFGIPDEKYGEEICAWIVLKQGVSLQEEDIKTFCKEQIAHYKVPRHIRFVDELPMTVTGKPQKFKMREAMIEELGLSQTETA